MNINTNLKSTISIAKNDIGDNSPVFIVAETGVTADGAIEKGMMLIEGAKQAGADAIKFQTIDCDEFMSDKTIEYRYETIEGFKKENMYEMLKKNQFTPYELIQLSNHAKQMGIAFYLSVDTLRSVEWAENANVSAYKIGSWDLRNYPLLKEVAKTGKPIQMDLGPVILGEVVQMIEFLEKHGVKELMLVHCSHSVTIQDFNINTISYLKEIFNIPIGYSADTREILLDVMAITLGAKMVEKRLTLDRNIIGHHHINSLGMDEFKLWISTIRGLELALGTKCINPSIEDLTKKSLYFTSIVASRDIAYGECISRDMLSVKRPGTGVSPFYIDKMLGKRVSRDFKEDEVITWDDWGSFV